MFNSVHIINQLFEMRCKANDLQVSGSFERNFNRLFSIFEEEGYVIQDPTGEPYTDSRTDCEASISGQVSAKMRITRTLKPIIYLKKDAEVQLLQKAIVIAENN